MERFENSFLIDCILRHKCFSTEQRLAVGLLGEAAYFLDEAIRRGAPAGHFRTRQFEFWQVNVSRRCFRILRRFIIAFRRRKPTAFRGLKSFWHSICFLVGTLETRRSETELKTSRNRNELTQQHCKNPPHWRQPFQRPWNGSPPQGERVASHDPPLALSPYKSPKRDRQALRAFPDEPAIGRVLND
jgi:hypothetical protein